MDWIKIKTHHVFYDGFNKTTLWAWIRIMSLTAELEAIPNQRQILTTITQHEYKLLLNHLESEGKVLANILQKVLEDASNVKEKRDYWKSKKRQQREKLKNVPLDVNRESTIREDKRREDKIRLNTNTGDKSPAPKTVNKKLTPEHVKFLENWSSLYKQISGEDYKIDWAKDSKIVTNLIKNFGYDNVVKKAEVLFTACQNKKLWFTKGGIADFTVGKLSSKWNELLENSAKDPADVWLENELRKDGVKNG